MAMERWRPRWEMTTEPLRELARIQREMEDTFTRFFHGSAWPTWFTGVRPAPAVDMVEDDKEVMIRADLPGLEQKDVEVTVVDGTLSIRGERKEEKEAKEGEYYCCERWAGSFARTMALPAGVDTDKVQAIFKNGVLEVHLPKMKEAKGKRIEVQAA